MKEGRVTWKQLELLGVNLLKGKGAQSPASEPEELQRFPFSYRSFRCLFVFVFCWFALAETLTEKEKLSFVRDPLGLWGEHWSETDLV